MSLRWHDDGNAFLCDQCWKVVRRTRADPMPKHTCEKEELAKSQFEQKGADLDT